MAGGGGGGSNYLITGTTGNELIEDSVGKNVGDGFVIIYSDGEIYTHSSSPSPASSHPSPTPSPGSGGDCHINSYRGVGNKCVCNRGFIPVEDTGELTSCSPCASGKSTEKDGDTSCIVAASVAASEKRCLGYPSLLKSIPSLNVQIKYMKSSEEKMLVFSGVTEAFFDDVHTVEARFMLSFHKEKIGNSSFANVLSKKNDHYDQRYLLAVPSYIGQTSFHLSFPSCVEHLLKDGQYISKLRLKFFSVRPDDMLTYDTIVGCKDFQLEPSSPFVVDTGVCVDNPETFSLHLTSVM